MRFGRISHIEQSPRINVRIATEGKYGAIYHSASLCSFCTLDHGNPADWNGRTSNPWRCSFQQWAKCSFPVSWSLLADGPYLSNRWMFSIADHGDVMKWRHFARYWPFVRGIHHRVPGEFPAQRPVTRSFDVSFDLLLNKRLSKQSWGWWFETLSCPLWRHCNVVGGGSPDNDGTPILKPRSHRTPRLNHVQDVMKIWWTWS